MSRGRVASSTSLGVRFVIARGGVVVVDFLGVVVVVVVASVVVADFLVEAGLSAVLDFLVFFGILF